MRNAQSRKFEQLSYMQALNMGLKVMDSTALSLCKDNEMPIIVFNLHQQGALAAIACGKKYGTLVSSEDTRDVRRPTPKGRGLWSS